jgi:hypothetical protein
VSGKLNQIRYIRTISKTPKFYNSLLLVVITMPVILWVYLQCPIASFYDLTTPQKTRMYTEDAFVYRRRVCIQKTRLQVTAYRRLVCMQTTRLHTEDMFAAKGLFATYDYCATNNRCVHSQNCLVSQTSLLQDHKRLLCRPNKSLPFIRST